jgi:uncharacterized protein (TIGR04255 family)
VSVRGPKVKYEQNFLKEVVFQVRFEPILRLETEAPADFQSAIKERFPAVQAGQAIEIDASASVDKGFDAKVRSTRKTWTFFTKDKTRSLTVESSALTLSYTVYKNFDEVQSDVDFLWERFQTIYSVETLSRIGLRYINVIEIDGNPLDWAGLIAPTLLDMFAIPSPEDHGLLRAIHTVFWGSEDTLVKFSYGIYNTEFPAPPVHRQFILDYDCYSVAPKDARDIRDTLIQYITVIYGLFERGITNGLRDIMRPIPRPASEEEFDNGRREPK